METIIRELVRGMLKNLLSYQEYNEPDNPEELEISSHLEDEIMTDQEQYGPVPPTTDKWWLRAQLDPYNKDIGMIGNPRYKR